MSRGKKIALGMLLAVVALGVAAALLGPSMVRDTVETQLKDRLDRRGIDAQWTEFNAGFGKRFEIKGLNVHDPKRGTKLTTDEVIVVVSIDSIIANDPRLEAIKLKNVQVEVDLAQAAKHDEEQVEEPNAPRVKRKGFVERLLADPPAVDVDGAQLNIVSGEREVLSVSTQEATVSIDDGMLDFETTVAAKPLLDKLPEALQASVEAHLAFQLEVATGKATFEFRHPEPDRPLFSYEDKETAALRLGSIRGTGNLKERTVDVELDYFSGRVGSSDAPAVSADIPKTLAGINQDGGLKLTMVDAAFLATPKKRGQIREIAKVAKELVSSAPGGGGRGFNLRQRAVGRRPCCRVNRTLRPSVQTCESRGQPGGRGTRYIHQTHALGAFRRDREAGPFSRIWRDGGGHVFGRGGAGSRADCSEVPAN